MKSSYYLLPVALTAMLAASCSSDNALQTEPAESGSSVTFTLRAPGGDKVIYTKADGEIHEADEYAITSLSLYEYEVTEEGTLLRRILKKGGNGRNALELTENADRSYTFSIIVPADNDGKQFTYRFIANDPVADPALESSFDLFAGTTATLKLADGNQSADYFAAEETGIAMTGVATSEGSEVITMKKGLKCDVLLKRIVSRIDLRYQTPNLKVTKVELTGAPASGTLFPGQAIPAVGADEGLSLALNARTPYPTDFLSKLKKPDSEDPLETFEMKKAFYIYERQNSEASSVNVHIEYQVSANGLDSYKGSVDVPFCKTDGSGEYVDAVRNHLYTIVLGNGKDPISGHVSATLLVEDWNGVDIDEPLTDDDKILTD